MKRVVSILAGVGCVALAIYWKNSDPGSWYGFWRTIDSLLGGFQ
jgi:hypothetical protein